MNHIYRVIYNATTNTYQAVPENSTGKHKSASEKSPCALSDDSEKGAFFSLKPMALCAMAMGLSSTNAFAAPVGGVLSAGEASIQQHGKITNIHQTSPKAAINWQQFGIQADETVNFRQPDSQAVILNRVIGKEKSVIDGAMNANGKVFISNPNGMLIGKNAQINVGSLIASTGKISNQDFMNGVLKFDQATGAITQLGDIKVPTGGVVALIAPIVANKGKIAAPQGKVLLASAEQFSITLPENGFDYTLSQGTLQGLVDNGGAILADGGHVVLTAKGVDAVKKSLIQHTGLIEANTVQNKNGVIELLGDLDNTRLEASGSLKAEAHEKQGDGGFIETSAAEVSIRDLSVSTKSKFGKTGEWLIDPQDFTINEGTGAHTNTGIGAETLSSNLQNTNVNIATVTEGNEKGDIYVNAPVSWDKNTLTLSAHNDIHINKTMNGTGTAKLALKYGQETADGGTSDYHIKNGVRVNLPEGKNFTTQKGNNGEKLEFDVIHKMLEIIKNDEGIWVSEFSSKNIAVGSDVDLKETQNKHGFSGWLVTANANIDGLGHTLSNLNISTKNENVGLFQEVSNGKISNLSIIDADIKVMDTSKTSVGILAGNAKNSSIKNTNVSGQIKVDAQYTEKSSTNNNISKADSSTYIGGVLGSSETTNISKIQSNTTIGVSINSTSSAESIVGGIVGFLDKSSISESYAIGKINTNSNAGSKSFGVAISGGLVGGAEESIIKDSYSANSVTATSRAGNPFSYVGGLVGDSRNSQLSNMYYSGDNINSSASNRNWSGRTYQAKGGIVGIVRNSSILSSYSDKRINIQALGLIDDNIHGQQTNPTEYGSKITNVDTKNTAELTQKSTFTDWDFDNIWYINDGETPKLHAHKKGTIAIAPVTPTPINKTDLAVNAHHLKKTYDGKVVETENDLRAIAKANGYDDIATISGLKNGDTLDKLGTLTYNGTWKNAKNAGKYSVIPTGLTGGQDYEIKYGEGNLTIDKRPVEAVLIGEKTYDTKKTAEVKHDAIKVNQNGIVDETVKFSGSVTLADKNVGSPDITDASKVKLTGQAAENYELKSVTGAWRIRPQSVDVTLTGNKVYNASDKVAVSHTDKSMTINAAGIHDADMDKVKLTGEVQLNSKDVGVRQLADYAKLALTGDEAKNYTIGNVVGRWRVTPQSVDATAIGTKVYNDSAIANIDDTTKVGLSRNEEGIYEADLEKVKLSGSVTLHGKDVGTHAIKDFSNATLTGDEAKNYVLNQIQGHWKITPATVVINTKNVGLKGDREYDATANAYAKDVDMTHFNNQLYANDKGKVQIAGVGKLKNIHVGEQPLQDKGTLALTGDAAQNYDIQVSGSKWNITPAISVPTVPSIKPIVSIPTTPVIQQPVTPSNPSVSTKLQPVVPINEIPKIQPIDFGKYCTKTSCKIYNKPVTQLPIIGTNIDDIGEAVVDDGMPEFKKPITTNDSMEAIGGLDKLSDLPIVSEIKQIAKGGLPSLVKVIYQGGVGAFKDIFEKMNNQLFEQAFEGIYAEDSGLGKFVIAYNVKNNNILDNWDLENREIVAYEKILNQYANEDFPSKNDFITSSLDRNIVHNNPYSFTAGVTMYAMASENFNPYGGIAGTAFVAENLSVLKDALDPVKFTKDKTKKEIIGIVDNIFNKVQADSNIDIEKNVNAIENINKKIKDLILEEQKLNPNFNGLLDDALRKKINKNIDKILGGANLSIINSYKIAINNSVDISELVDNITDITTTSYASFQAKELDRYAKLVSEFMEKGSKTDKLKFVAQQKFISENPDVDLTGKYIFVIKENKGVFGSKFTLERQLVK